MNVKSRCEIMKNEGVSITHIERLQNAYYVCFKWYALDISQKLNIKSGSKVTSVGESLP